MGGLDPQEPLLRELRPNEAEALQSFYDGLSEVAHCFFRPLGLSPSPADYANVCSDAASGRRHDLVLEAGGRIVGWAFLQAMDTSTPTLGIGIADPFTGRGHGKRLMIALIQRARELDKEAIDLCHVVGNERAHRLYHGLGFIVTGHFRGQDGLDYVRMRLTL
jgi:RimJ/RimL family protein N-acetyltransferase